MAALVASRFGGEGIDPMKLIPPRYRPDDPPPPPKRSAEAERRAAELILSRL